MAWIRRTCGAMALCLAILGAGGEAAGRPAGRYPWFEDDPPAWRPTPHDDCLAFGAPHLRGFVVGEHRFSPRWFARTLHGVIADHCRSKTYRDLYALDGGTVGISHFASGSLRTLHRHMDARRYFGWDAEDIPDRPYRLGWWRAGMRRFLASPEARAVQQRAWRAYITPVLRLALQRGWRTDRHLAIAAGIANSLGPLGFRRLASRAYWLPERTLFSYARLTAHKDRRRLRINREFPRGREGTAYSIR